MVSDKAIRKCSNCCVKCCHLNGSFVVLQVVTGVLDEHLMLMYLLTNFSNNYISVNVLVENF